MLIDLESRSSSDTCAIRRLAHQGPADVSLWLIDLDAQTTLTSGLVSTEAERTRAARFVFADDARRYLASRRALRHVLSWTLACEPSSLLLGEDAVGKPVLLGGGELHFNLSHSGRWALVGCCRSMSIGVDLEVLREVDNVQDLAGTCLTCNEQASWHDGSATLSARFLAAWVRKEACLKALGVGLAAALNQIDVGFEPQCRDVCVPLAARHCEVQLYPCESSPQWVAAMAVAANEQVIAARNHYEQVL